jgi:hypothetical protein
MFSGIIVFTKIVCECVYFLTFSVHTFKQSGYCMYHLLTKSLYFLPKEYIHVLRIVLGTNIDYTSKHH